MAPIVVEATSSEWVLSLAGFYSRRDKGFGRFVTSEDIQRRKPPNLSAMLSASGITMRCVRTACDMLGIEVYRQGADTPAEFSRWSAACGAILIWTKN